MNGRIEKMPNVTKPRVANVQKKSLERKAWKKAINAGSCRAASTVATPAATNTAMTGTSHGPSGARRIANNAISATTNDMAQMTATGGTRMRVDAATGRMMGGSLTATTVLSSVMARMTATTP